MVKVLAYTHPLRNDRVEAEVADGQSIREIVGNAPVHAWINGCEVPAELLAYVRPKPGALLIVRPVPQGGDTFRMVALIAVAAVATYVTAGGAAGAFGAAFEAGGFGAIAAGAGVAIGGSLLVNTLIPAQLPGMGSGGGESFNRLSALTGTANQVAAFQPIPRLYGEFRFFPPTPMTALPYTELVGSDQYLRAYFCLGYGPLQIGGVKAGDGSTITQDTTLSGTPIKIGDTTISLFDDVEFEICDASDVTLYSNQIVETAPGWTTQCDVTGLDIKADPQWVSDGGSAIRSTDTDASEISIDLTFPGGLFSVSLKGLTTLAKVEFKIEYRLVGATPWTVLANPWTVSSSKRETFRVGRRWKVAAGQYEVQLTRIRTWHHDFEGVADQATWTALRTIRSHKPFVVDHTVVMAVRIRATDQLNGQLDTLSVEATSILPVWDGAAWVDTVTRVPAWIYADILTGTANGDPLSKDKLDVDELTAWATETAAAGRHYDGVFDDNATVFGRLQEVATTGRASFGLNAEAKVSVVRDTAQTTPKMVISPRNSFGFTSTLAFVKAPHAFRVRFIDPGTYEDTERLVFDDGYSEANATRYEVLQTKGVKSADQAWKDGRYHLAQLRLRPESFMFSQDVQHLRYRRGDLLTLTHDVILVGLGAGRVTGITTEVGGSIVGFDSDEQLFMEAAKSYAVKLQLQDGSIATVGIATESPFTTAPSLTVATDGISVGDHFVYGEAGSESLDVKVSGIAPRGDFVAQVTCVPAAGDILDAETGDIPDYTPVLTRAIDVNALPPPKPTLTEIRSDESVMVRDIDGSYHLRLMVHAALPSFPGMHAQLQARVKNQNDGTGWITSAPVDASSGVLFFADPHQGDTYDVQVRAVREGKASVWSATTAHTIIGKSSPPPDVAVLSLQQNGTATVMRWSQVVVPDLLGYELRYMSQNQPFSWGQALLLSEVTRGTQVTTAMLPPGRWFVGIKAVDTSSNYSATPRVSSVIVLSGNDVIYEDEQSPDWPGTVQGFDVVEQPWIPNGGFDTDDLSGWEDTNGTVTSSHSILGDTASGSLAIDGQGGVHSLDYKAVDPSREYTITGSFYTASATNYIYMGVTCYDAQQRYIGYSQAWRDNAKDTTLYAAVSIGDTTVDIVPASEDWFVVTTPFSYIQLGIVSDGSDLPAIGNTYRISDIDKSAGTYWRLTTSPMTTAYAAGTQVGNSRAGPGHNYVLVGSEASASSFTARSFTMTGTTGPFEQPVAAKFRFGTAYIRYLVLPNHDDAAGRTYIDDVSMAPATPLPSDGLVVLQLSDAPGDLATYTAPYLDAGFKDDVRVWAEVQASAPAGEVADPQLEVRIATGDTGDALMWDADGTTLMWGDDIDSVWSAWGEWQPWSVGQVSARLVQHRLTYDPANGSPTLLGFKPVVDVPPRAEGKRNVSASAAGLDVLFSKPFHAKPLIKLTAADSAVLPVRANVTTLGFTIRLYSLSGAATAGTVDWQASTE